MTEQWNELKETIKELRDNNGTSTQQMICRFLANYMDILEKQMQESDSDLISRKMVVEFLRSHSKDLEGTRNETIKFSQAFMFAASTIKDTNIIPSIDIPTKSEWISVNDYLPTKNFTVGDVLKQYLIQDEYGDMYTAKYTNNGWEEAYRLVPFEDKIVAWQPLPEQYKVVEE